ncbi:MAG TPA: PspC domain-containing protein [Nakamurella sp.]
MSDLNETQQLPADKGVRRLLRSRTDRVFGGVCGGLGRYLNVDPVLLRIAAVALALSGGAGVIAYIVAWIVIPEDTGEEPPGPQAPAHRHGIAVAVGAGLIALGALLMMRDVLPWFGLAMFWPIVVVGVGLLVLISARR